MIKPNIPIQPNNNISQPQSQDFSKLILENQNQKLTETNQLLEMGLELSAKSSEETNKLLELQLEATGQPKEVQKVEIQGAEVITIKGDKGDKGDTGEKGEKGDKGEKGEQGTQGIQGKRGEKGAVGERGEKGEAGLDGQDGKNGKDGKDGKSPTIKSVLKAIKVNWKDIQDKPEFPKMAGTGYLREISDVELAGVAQGDTLKFNGNKWVKQAPFIENELLGTGDDTTTDFTLANTPESTSGLEIFVGGSRTFLTDDYTVSGTTVSFIEAPPATAKIYASYQPL